MRLIPLYRLVCVDFLGAPLSMIMHIDRPLGGEGAST